MRAQTDLCFTENELIRADHLRAAARPNPKDSEAVLFWRSKPLVDTLNNTLVKLPVDHRVLKSTKTQPIFIGLSHGINIFAYDISHWEPSQNDTDPTLFYDPTQVSHPNLDPTQVFTDLRSVMAFFTPRDAEIAATGQSILSWNQAYNFCPSCGGKLRTSHSGWQKSCSKCGKPQFPRTDPVVIMLVTSGNKTLLGRSHDWPEGMYSCLAGFVETGETIEAAVARETNEEAGIIVKNVRYVASQPWPFPGSLMLGCIAEATSDKISVDPEELDDAQWFSKETLLAAYAGKDINLKPARKGSIASFLIRNWVTGSLY